MDLVLWILPKCRQGGGGGPKSRKLCRRHLSMAPKMAPPQNVSRIQILDGPAQSLGFFFLIFSCCFADVPSVLGPV